MRTLPRAALPHGLPRSYDCKGLFQVEPTDGRFEYTVDTAITVAPNIDKPVKTKLHVKRYQLPVLPAQVKTIHVAQGGGWPAVIADVKRPPRVPVRQHWLITCVALSRAETLAGLLLLRLCSREELEAGAPQYLLDEIDRLLQLEKISTEKLASYIQSLRVKVPQSVLDLFKPSTAETAAETRAPSATDTSTEECKPDLSKATAFANAAASAPAAPEERGAPSAAHEATRQRTQDVKQQKQETGSPTASEQIEVQHRDDNRPEPPTRRTQPPPRQAGDSQSGAPRALPADPTAPATNAYLLRLPVTTASEILGYDFSNIPALRSCTRGLHNIGNTCWANAMLFAICSNPFVAAWSAAHASHGGCVNVGNNTFCPLCALAADTKGLASQASSAPFAPSSAEERRNWNPTFADTRQHDAQETFVTFLDACNDADLLALQEETTPANVTLVKHTLPMWQCFGFVLKTQSYCPCCTNSYYSYALSNCLHLPVAPRSPPLHELFAAATAPQDIQDKDDKCRTIGCTRARPRLQQLQLASWPRTLVINLVRFRHNRRANAFSKLNHCVAFKLEEDFGSQALYILRAAVVHTGTFHGSHYTTYVNTFAQGRLHCDDSRQPRKVKVGEVLAAQAYLLFYQKDRWSGHRHNTK